MTTLHSILKNGEITLPKMIHIVKAMVFPVVMYGCESWAIKKAERQELMPLTLVLEKTLDSPLDSKDIKQSILREINPEYSLARLMLKMKLQYFDQPMLTTELFEKTLILGKIEGRRRRG